MIAIITQPLMFFYFNLAYCSRKFKRHLYNVIENLCFSRKTSSVREKFSDQILLHKGKITQFFKNFLRSPLATALRSFIKRRTTSHRVITNDTSSTTNETSDKE